MLYTKQGVQDNVRNRDGSRVLFLQPQDRLTDEARDYLNREKIRVLEQKDEKPEHYRLLGGGYTQEKPEHMTHLDGQTLIAKTHPRIAFRGALDLLESELLLAQQQLPDQRQVLQQLLELARRLMRCDVLQEEVGAYCLDGLSPEQLRKYSHYPQQYCGQPHFMPSYTDPLPILALNRLRCLTRSAELAAAHAFCDRDGLPTRVDILQALNRMSSMLYLLMIRCKASITS